MRVCGYVRKINNRGLVVIPKEITKRLEIEEGDVMQCYTTEEGVAFKKYFGNDLKTEVLAGGTRIVASGILKRIDNIGRVLVPAHIRRTAGMQDDSYVEITTIDNAVLIKSFYKCTVN